MFGRRRKKLEKPLETDINRVVTPMLDMTFQLLFYFVINFKPPSAEAQLDLRLPAPETGPPAEVNPIDDTKPDEYTIQTVVDKNGVLAGLRFRVKTFDPETLEGALLPALEAKLKTIPRPAEGDKSAKQPIIKIECAKNLKYHELVTLMNLCRELGLKEVNILPIPPARVVAPEPAPMP